LLEAYSGITREEIEALLAEAETDQGLLADAAQWNIKTATESGYVSELVLENLFVTGTAAIDTLSLSQSLTVGNDLVISSVVAGEQLTVNSIDTLAAPLAIQSSANQPLYIMAGKMIIDTNGDVTIEGNLFVAGRIESSSVATDKLIVSGGETTSTYNSLGDYTIEADSSAGSAKIPDGLAEVTIVNQNVDTTSLIYVTPTTSTENKVLYVKEQADGSFTVGFDEALTIEVNFNWWIVELSKKASTE